MKIVQIISFVILLATLQLSTCSAGIVRYDTFLEWSEATVTHKTQGFENAEQYLFIEGISDVRDPSTHFPRTGGTASLSYLDIIIPLHNNEGTVRFSRNQLGSRFAGDVHGPDSAENALEYNQFAFHQPVFGVAFTLLDASSEHLLIRVGNQEYEVAGRDGNEFFGIFGNTPFQHFEIRNHGRNLEFYRLESINFALPEPSSLFFLLACIPTVGCVRLRR